MPLFMVKKEVLNGYVLDGRPLSLGDRAREGEKAVFQCGRNVLRGIIVKKEEGSLTDVLRQDNYKKIIPSANDLEEAITYLKSLYGIVEGTFTAYYFTCNIG
jgi:hypothetical protein